MKKSIKTTKEVEETIGIICDVCGREENTVSPKGWTTILSKHDEWGSESSDSVEVYEVCSVECYFKKIKELMNENEYWKNSFEVDEKDWTFLTNLILFYESKRA